MKSALESIRRGRGVGSFGRDGSEAPRCTASESLLAHDAGYSVLATGRAGLLERFVDPRRPVGPPAGPVRLVDGLRVLPDPHARERSGHAGARRSSRCGRPSGPCTSCLPGRSPGAPGRTGTSLLVVRKVGQRFFQDVPLFRDVTELLAAAGGAPPSRLFWTFLGLPSRILIARCCSIQR